MDQKTAKKVGPHKAAPVVTPPEGLADLSFEAAVTQLEQTVQALENGQLPLAQALQAYQQGSELVRHAQGLLDRVQAEIEVIEAGQQTSVDRSALISKIKD